MYLLILLVLFLCLLIRAPFDSCLSHFISANMDVQGPIVYPFCFLSIVFPLHFYVIFVVRFLFRPSFFYVRVLFLLLFVANRPSGGVAFQDMKREQKWCQAKSYIGKRLHAGKVPSYKFILLSNCQNAPLTSHTKTIAIPWNAISWKVDG